MSHRRIPLSQPAAKRHAADHRTIDILRQRCWSQGYALTEHGSRGPKDLDLVAVAWTDRAVPHRDLIDHLIDAEIVLSHAARKGEKPHGRMPYILVRVHDHRIIDLSVMPPPEKPVTSAHQEKP